MTMRSKPARRRSSGDVRHRQAFAAGLGADISGVDTREPLSTTDPDAIRAAMN